MPPQEFDGKRNEQASQDTKASASELASQPVEDAATRPPVPIRSAEEEASDSTEGSDEQTREAQLSTTRPHLREGDSGVDKPPYTMEGVRDLSPAEKETQRIVFFATLGETLRALRDIESLRLL